jgi:hypothetical protein
LAESLRGAGVELSRQPDDELLTELKEKGEVSAFAKLLSEFLTPFKQSYLAQSKLWDTAKSYLDAERLRFLLKILSLFSTATSDIWTH